MSDYKLTPVARRGLRETYFYVKHAFGIDVAETVVEKILAAFHRLAANPAMGHSRGDLTLVEDVRFWPVGPTLIAYRHRGNTVEVLLVERANRDWPALINDLDLDPGAEPR